MILIGIAAMLAAGAIFGAAVYQFVHQRRRWKAIVEANDESRAKTKDECDRRAERVAKTSVVATKTLTALAERKLVNGHAS